MNIFVLDLDPKACAEYHCDAHLVKMITEHNQILGSIAYTARGVQRKKDITADFVLEHFQGFPRKCEDGSPKPYGIGYTNHPCTKWASSSAGNYEWLCQLTRQMCKEYTRRYGRVHAGEAICNWYSQNRPLIKSLPLTPFAQAMPEVCKSDNVVAAYQNYYVQYKSGFARWRHSDTPSWYTAGLLQQSLLKSNDERDER
jgi:hypothetical protein